MLALQEIKQGLKHVLQYMLYNLSSILSRSGKQWVFGHLNGYFGGNPKYLYLWVTLHYPDIKATWITRNRSTARILRSQSYRARWRWCPAGIWTTLRAGVFVYGNSVSDINHSLSKGAFLLNLWHGVGIKTIGKQAQAATETHQKAIPATLKPIKERLQTRKPDLLVTTSDFMQTHFSEQLDLHPESCPQLGYPRLDCFADKSLAEAAIGIDSEMGFQFNPDGFAEVYLYVPTWRETGRPFFSEALPDSERFSAVLGERNALLYLKPHPNTSENVPAAHNIRHWPEEVDIHPYLGLLTGLITDYSSVLYDYLFLSAGSVILYTFDQEQYLSSDRTLRYDYDENTAGLRVSSFDKLCQIFHNDTAVNTPPSSDVEFVRQRFWGGSPMPASPAIIDRVRRHLAE